MKKIKKYKYKIEKAKISDVVEIHKLINHFSKSNLMLPRVVNDIYERIREFFVLKISKGKEQIISGCVALHITWTGRSNEVLGEVRSLAVSDQYQGKGFGRKLVLECHKEAKKIGIKSMFALTYVPDFFIKLGYKIAPKESLPHKVWTECINCPFFLECRETLVIKSL